MRFPRHLARTLPSCADARYVGDNLVVANALGVDHPELGDRERYVLDVRNPWSDDDAERVLRRLMAHVHVTAIPVLDGGPVPREAAVRAVAWYENVRSEHSDALVVVNCLMGASRSATVAYALLRRCHGLDHTEAFRRVATRAHKATDTRFWPSQETLSDVRAWCDAAEAT